MSNSNKISVAIPPATLTEVMAKLNDIRQLLQPYLQALTPDEKQALPKMSDKTIAFVQKTINYSHNNPEFVPPFLDVPELDKDFDVVEKLKPVLDLCEQLCSNIGDTTFLAGSEAYTGALMYYNSVKLAARTGQPNAKTIYEDLSTRFPGVRRKEPLPAPSNN